MEIILGDKKLILSEKILVGKKDIPEVRKINCIFDKEFRRHSNTDKTVKNFWFYLDERDNTLHFKQGMVGAPQEMKDYMNYLISGFSILKLSDFRYGTIGTDVEFPNEPTINITGEDFLNFVKSNYRQETINNILK